MNKIHQDMTEAIQNGNTSSVRKLINIHGLSYSELWDEGYVLLLSSVELKHIEITKLFLNSGCKVNSKCVEVARSNTPLHFAVKNGDIEIIELLLDRGTAINVQNQNGSTPLLCATEQGKEEIVELLLKKGAHVDSICDVDNARKGFTPLHWAVANNNKDITVLLLSHGACVNSKTKEGLTPMYFASANGNVELIKLLLKNNAEVDPCAKNKMTPLYIAIRNNHREAAKLLMDEGANVDAEDKNGKTILSVAVERSLCMIVDDILQHCPDINNASNKNSLKIAAGHYDDRNPPIVEHLLKYGFSVGPEDINDSALLDNSLHMGYVTIIEQLLKLGFDLTTCNRKTQDIPLHIAVKNNKIEIAILLLKYGADVNAINKIGKPAIFYSTEMCNVNMTKMLLLHGANIQKNPELLRIATKNFCQEMVEILLQNHADIDATDKFGRTALHLSVSNEYFGKLSPHDPIVKTKGEIAKLLLSNGANANAKTTKEGITALHIACQKNYINIVEVLLQYNADVNCATQNSEPGSEGNGETGLHIAAKKSYLELLKLLLKSDANVNCKDSKGATPLHVATSCGVEKKNPRIISILLDHGASINARDNEGKTALHIASKLGKNELVKLLLKFGADINILTNNNYRALDFAYDVVYYARAGIDFCASDDEPDVDEDYPVRCDERQLYKWDSVIETIRLHILLLKTANLYLSESNLRALQGIDQHELLKLELYEDKYMEEVKKMKNMKMVYDMLTKNISSLANYVKNKDVLKVFEFNLYKLDFPFYGDLIERNFKRAIKRNLLLQSAHEHFESHFKLPHDCADKVFSYLSDDDLKSIADI